MITAPKSRTRWSIDSNIILIERRVNEYSEMVAQIVFRVVKFNLIEDRHKISENSESTVQLKKDFYLTRLVDSGSRKNQKTCDQAINQSVIT